MTKRIIRGYHGRGVPTTNTEPWASYKARRYGISHSLGTITGKLYAGVSGLEPDITTFQNTTTLHADFSNIPADDKFPYLKVVHERGDRLRQRYPFVRAAREMTHKNLLRRLNKTVSDAWKSA